MGSLLGLLLKVVCLELAHKLLDSLNTDPLESWFLRLRVAGLRDQPDGLKHVGDVVQTSNLGLELLLLDVEAGDGPRCFLERDNSLPGNEQLNELLAKDAKRLVFFVFSILLRVLAQANLQGDLGAHVLLILDSFGLDCIGLFGSGN
jgi:hypothetical protein